MVWEGGGQYFEVDPDGLKIKTVTGGDGNLHFTDSQLRAAYPAIAEEAIAYKETGPWGTYLTVLIDQVQENIVRLRGRYNTSRDPGFGCKLLYGQTLGMEKCDWGRRRLFLSGAPLVLSVPAYNEDGNLMTNEELQARDRAAKEKGVPLKWKQKFVGENGMMFVPDTSDE